MKKSIMTIVSITVFLALSYAQNTPSPEKTKTDNAVVCPVSGEKISVNENTPKTEYNGKTYYFCCQNCAEKFKKEPAKYASQAAAGKIKMCGTSCSCECCKNGKCDCSKGKCECKDCKCHDKGDCDCKNGNMKKHKSHKGKQCANCPDKMKETKKEQTVQAPAKESK